jgi:uncharacterized tellurite resistance protein B-like protein
MANESKLISFQREETMLGKREIASISRAIAVVLWADNKVLEEELVAARALYARFGITWTRGKKVLEEELEALLEYDSDGVDDAPLIVAPLVLETISPLEFIYELAKVACSDMEITWDEVDVLHLIGRAMVLDPRVVTAALLKAMDANSGNVDIVMEGFDDGN